MVKTVGAYPENRGLGLSPDFGLAVLHHAQTGQLLAVLDAGPLTRWRTAALAAWAALQMARAPSRVLCVIGARGIAPIAAELICEGAEIAEVRFISRSAGTAREAADALSRSRPVAARAARDIEDAMDGADIVLDGPGLSAHTALLPATAIGPGTTVVSYGAFSSLPADIVSHTDGLIVDRWVEGDTGATGALGPAIAAGRAERRHVRAFLPDIATGRTAGRHGDDERLLVVLRGLAPCDITLSRHLAEAATDRRRRDPTASVRCAEDLTFRRTVHVDFEDHLNPHPPRTAGRRRRRTSGGPRDHTRGPGSERHGSG